MPGEEVAVGRAADEEGGTVDREGLASGGDGELGTLVRDARAGDGVVVEGAEGDVDVSSAVEVLDVDHLAADRVREGRDRRRDRELLGLGEVQGAAGVPEAAGHEEEGVPADGQVGDERVAVGVGQADADRGGEGDEGTVRAAQLDLAAVDGAVVEAEALGGPERDLEEVAAVDEVAADGGARQADDLLGGGGRRRGRADDVARGAGDEEGLRLGVPGRRRAR